MPLLFLANFSVHWHTIEINLSRFSPPQIYITNLIFVSCSHSGHHLSPSRVELLRSRNLSVSHFDVRVSGGSKRNSSSLSSEGGAAAGGAVGGGVGKISRHSLDSQTGMSRTTPRSRSLQGTRPQSNSPRESRLSALDQENVFEAVKE